MLVVPIFRRFIPTPVGNTKINHSSRIQTTVHPHTRGEHIHNVARPTSERGSSPHPWGTHPGERNGQLSRRFIPTPVGNTSSPSRKKSACAVHPHTRGEHGREPHRHLGQHGSSPHPWGTLVPGWGDLERVRFIPTPVGNTPPLRRRPPRDPVHPHTRGEHAGWINSMRTYRGSSPHPWGTLFLEPTEFRKFF